MTSVASSWTERLQQSVGPIVVKEIRQGLRAKVFAIFFGLLLSACLVVAFIAVAQVEETRSGRLGKQFLATYLIALGVVCYLVIPYTAFRSLLREREDETWVLLVLTGLGARNIVRGKFTSAMSQAMLFASACAPFVVFSYYLNGVDIVQVGLGLVMSAAWTCLLTSLGLGVATQAESRLGRTAAHFFMLALLAGGAMMAFAFSVVLADEGGRLIHENGFLAFCLGVTAASVGGTLVVLEGASAGLALSTEAASKGPRIALVLFIAAAWAFAGLGEWLGKPDEDAALVGSIATSLVLVVAGAFAISERDGWTHATRVKGWLKPGAMRSYVVIVALLAASTVVWLSLYAIAAHGFHSERRLGGIVAAPLYVFLYLSIGAFLGRATPLSRLREPLASRIGFGVGTSVGALLPPLLAVLGGGRAIDRSVNHLNPLIGMVNFIDRLSDLDVKLGLTMLVVASVFFGFLAWVMLASKDQEYTS